MTIVMSSSSNPTNSTEELDFYCTEMPAGPIIWTVFSVPCACVGFPASVWLLWVLVQRQRSGLTNDIYILNLTVMDVVFSLCIIPAILNFFVWRDEIFQKLIDFLYCFNLTGRPLFMTCICVDCFMAVVYPVIYMKVKRSSYRWLPCAGVWGFTILFGLLPVYYAQLFMSSYSAVPYIISIPTIVACDLAISLALRKPDPSGRTDVHPQKQRALQTITTSLVITLVCYLPVLVVCPLLSFIPITDQEKFCIITLPVLITPLSGSIVMPLLQLHSLGKLRGLQWCGRVSGSSEQPA